MKKLDPDDMQNVVAAHVGGGGGGLVIVPSLPPPHEIRPIDRIRAPNRQEIFRILPPKLERLTLTAGEDQPTWHES